MDSSKIDVTRAHSLYGAVDSRTTTVSFFTARPATPLPFATWEYRPDYLPRDRCFLFADELPLSEPEVFILSWPQGQSSPAAEPTKHPLGLREMRSVSVGLPDPTSISNSLRAIRDAGLVNIHRSNTPGLVIEFASQNDIQKDVPTLWLSLVGHQAVARAGHGS